VDILEKNNPEANHIQKTKEKKKSINSISNNMRTRKVYVRVINLISRREESVLEATR